MAHAHNLDWLWQEEAGQQSISEVWVTTILVLGDGLVEGWLLSGLNPGGFIL